MRGASTHQSEALQGKDIGRPPTAQRQAVVQCYPTRIAASLSLLAYPGQLYGLLDGGHGEYKDEDDTDGADDPVTDVDGDKWKQELKN